jgi:hypothetical protein
MPCLAIASNNALFRHIEKKLKNLLTTLYRHVQCSHSLTTTKDHEMNATTQAKLTTEHARAGVAFALAQRMRRKAEQDAARAMVIQYQKQIANK